MSYPNGKEERREFGRWWMWVLGLSLLAVAAFTLLNYAGVIGHTVVERKVFENSYQYTAAQKERIATIEAQISELQGRLNNPKLDDGAKANINAQLSQLRIQLTTAQKRSQ